MNNTEHQDVDSSAGMYNELKQCIEDRKNQISNINQLEHIDVVERYIMTDDGRNHHLSDLDDIDDVKQSMECIDKLEQRIVELDKQVTNLHEMDLLKSYLKDHGYHISCEEGMSYVLGFPVHQIYVTNAQDHSSWDVICHYGSNGHEVGLLEVSGDIVDTDHDGNDDTIGGLTATDVINLLKRMNNKVKGGVSCE